MSIPINRTGVFVVAPGDEPALHAQSKRADALMLEDRQAWYLAVHELFEQAIAHSLVHRIIPGEFVGFAWGDFITEYVRTATVRFDDLSPMDVRLLLGSRLDEIEDEELRAAISDALAGPPGGIWVLSDYAMPPHVAVTTNPPTDRTGIFVIGKTDEATLRASSDRAEILQRGADPRAWYFGVKDLFEEAVAKSLAHRIVLGDAVEDAWVDFVVDVGQKESLRFDALSPAELRALLPQHLEAIEDEALRAAISDVLAGPPGGIWVLSERAMPPLIANPEPDVDDDRDEVPVAETVRLLHEYVANFVHSAPIDRVTAAELDAASVKDAAAAPNDEGLIARARVRARAKVETVDPAVVRATRELVAGAPVSRGRGIYDAAGARALLAWLEAGTETPAHAWLLPAVRAAVIAKRGIGIIFEIE